jgi:hypothetical protein
MHGSLQIHNNFYFEPKIYFIHFSIIKLKRKERKLSKNCKKKREKMIGCCNTDNKNSQTWC